MSPECKLWLGDHERFLSIMANIEPNGEAGQVTEIIEVPNFGEHHEAVLPIGRRLGFGVR